MTSSPSLDLNVAQLYTLASLDRYPCLSCVWIFFSKLLISPVKTLTHYLAPLNRDGDAINEVKDRYAGLIGKNFATVDEFFSLKIRSKNQILPGCRTYSAPSPRSGRNYRSLFTDYCTRAVRTSQSGLNSPYIFPPHRVLFHTFCWIPPFLIRCQRNRSFISSPYISQTRGKFRTSHASYRVLWSEGNIPWYAFISFMNLYYLACSCMWVFYGIILGVWKICQLGWERVQHSTLRTFLSLRYLSSRFVLFCFISPYLLSLPESQLTQRNPSFWRL
jgi:hypothetical protein